MQRLPDYLASSANKPAAASLLFIDLDDLKAINDNFGHAAGDQIIVSAAERIVRSIPPESFVARIGGDEFVAVLAGERDRHRIIRIAEKLIQSLARDYEVQGQRILTTGSIGISVCPDDGSSAEILLKNADSAMYAAKTTGRNCWRFFEPALQQDNYKKLTMIYSLRQALERNEFFLHYQPKVETIGGKLVGFEALTRWQSPEYGLVPPDRFIPLAEDSRLILPLGKWVLQEACAFARQLCDSGQGHLHVAVNISPRQLAAPDFIETVRSIVAAAGISPGQLELEVTETVLMESVDDVFCKLVELRDQGIRLALDDFGTGYSSLTYLRSLPLETLKIDKSFIRCLSRDEIQAQFVSHIIDMAHTLKLTVVAEGVETVPQWELLQQAGCDHIQGYLVCRPVPCAAALQFLQTNS